MNTSFGARDRADTQAILGTAFASLRHGRYALMRVDEAALARAWLRQVMDTGVVRSAADLGRHQRCDEAVALAFSARGLRHLGLHEHVDFPFPTAFDRGMRTRLGVTSAWEWSDAQNERALDGREVHAVLVHMRSDRAVGSTAALPAPDQLGSGWSVTWIDTCPSYLQPVDPSEREWIAYEPFGFRDGIAQPVIEGLSSDSTGLNAQRGRDDVYRDRVVASGEFVLGHPNEYGELAYCPDVIGWPSRLRPPRPASRFGLNGSYLAVQQIRQFVDDFHAFETHHGEPVTEKIVGRHKDGTPLSAQAAAGGDIDAFRYRVSDCWGFACPRGAHVRRSNPRDMLGTDVATGVAAAKLHRLLRRARVYRNGRCGAGTADSRCVEDGRREACGQGLFFIAANANLERQFEFVAQRWIGNPGFSDLTDELDPLLGEGPGRSFSMQAMPLGRRIEQLPQFTQTIGGGYYFLPSLSALRFIAD